MLGDAMEESKLESGLVILTDTTDRRSAAEKARHEYYSGHCRCPVCGGCEFESTCEGTIIDFTNPHAIDERRNTCTQCGWRGLEHQKIGQAHELELAHDETRHHAEAAMLHLWDALELSSSFSITPEIRKKRRQLYDDLGRTLLGYGVPEKETLC